VWPLERRACLAARRQKFLSYPPHRGDTPDEYLTDWLPIGDTKGWQNK
jgi:diadenosine tetraphosphatase ApaH/serine/threonine PP2A family protein phosphatase